MAVQHDVQWTWWFLAMETQGGERWRRGACCCCCCCCWLLLLLLLLLLIMMMAGAGALVLLASYHFIVDDVSTYFLGIGWKKIQRCQLKDVSFIHSFLTRYQALLPGGKYHILIMCILSTLTRLPSREITSPLEMSNELSK